MASSSFGIGIDFGATTCVVAMSKNGQTDVIANELGNRVTQNCVGFTPTENAIGDAAHCQKERNVTGTICRFKRLLGKEFDDEDTQEDLKEFEQFKNVKMVASSSSTCAIELPFTLEGAEGPEQMSLESVATLVFGKIKETAELYLGETVSHCVISLPGHYSTDDAEMLKKCCEETGVKVMRMVKDPIAASISAGLDQPTADKKEKTAVVFDLGGTSLDVSVVQVSPAGTMRVVGSSGSGSFGAKSFDDVLYDFCVKDMRRKDRKSVDQLKTDERAKMRLKKACDTAKKALSASKAASIEVEALIGDVDFSAQLSRQAFEDLLVQSGKMDTITDILEDALFEESKLDAKKDKIDSVLMIGGGSNIPKIKSLVEEWFKTHVAGPTPAFISGEGATTVAPEEAVAMGAAIQADLLLNAGDTFGELKTTCTLAEDDFSTAAEDDEEEPCGTIAMSGMVLNASIGLQVGSDFLPILLKGSAVPCSRKQKFGVNASWSAAVLEVCEKGSDGSTKKLAKITAPVHEKGSMEVEFAVSEQGVLTVESGEKKVVVKK